MYLWDLAMRKGALGSSIKYVLKSSLMKLPIFGWAFHIFELISVERKWEIDEPVLPKMLTTFTDRQDPIWLAVFPEGTVFTEQKCRRSQQFAAENGLPILKYVLLPKSKGFHACMELLKDSLDAGISLPLGMTFCNFISERHIIIRNIVRRILTKDIPTSELEATTWLMDTFKFKDQLLSDLVAQGIRFGTFLGHLLGQSPSGNLFNRVVHIPIIFLLYMVQGAYRFILYISVGCNLL